MPSATLGRLVAGRRRILLATVLAAAVVFALSFAVGRAGRSDASTPPATVDEPLKDPAPIAVARSRELPALGERPDIPPLKRKPRPPAAERTSGATPGGVETVSPPSVPSSPSPAAPSSGSATGGGAPSGDEAPSTGGGSSGGGGGGGDGVLCSPC